MRRRLRACLSVLLMFTLLGMVPARMTVAMPMAAQTAAEHHAHAQHGWMRMVDQPASSQPASHHGQHAPCHCAHCGLCGACLSAMPATLTTGFIAVRVMPVVTRISNLAEIWFPPDPRPPRA
jgi:hypothetical protein